MVTRPSGSTTRLQICGFISLPPLATAEATSAICSGVTVAGKTGTAETPYNDSCGGGAEENQAWFIGFAPAEDPKIAIAATVECTTQFGNDVAAPIFRDVAETILNDE